MSDGSPRPASKIFVLSTPAALADEAALMFASASKAAIRERGRFVVALSGGTTPKAMLGLLAGSNYASDIDWNGIHVFWGDERMVPPDDPSSNYGMATAELLSKVAIPSFQIHRMHGELDPQVAAAEYDKELRNFFAGPTAFDLTFLGLGPDGHTASLFPHTEALSVRDKLCVANCVRGENVVSPWRLTLTYPSLNASLAVLFLVEGPSKASIVTQVLKGPRNPQQLPAQGIAPKGTLAWLLDDAAANELRKASPKGEN